MILGVVAWAVILGALTTALVWPSDWVWRVVCLGGYSCLWAVVLVLWVGRRRTRRDGFITRKGQE